MRRKSKLKRAGKSRLMYIIKDSYIQGVSFPKNAKITIEGKTIINNKKTEPLKRWKTKRRRNENRLEKFFRNA